MSFDAGETLGELFDIVSPFCAYDVPTLPNDSLTSIAASRTNATPWASHNGNYRVLVYAERKLSSDGQCFTTFDAPTDSRIMAVVGSIDGSEWSLPVEVAPNPGHGFQYQPVVECSLGDCYAAWWDSRFDSQRVENYLTNVSGNPRREDALEAFLNLPVLGDFNFVTNPDTGRVIQFRRTSMLLATGLDIDSGVPVPLDTPPAVVSKYRQALVDGSVVDTQADPWNIKGYRSSTRPFMGDYSWLAAILQRRAEGDADPGSSAAWDDNRLADPLNPDKDPMFWLSFVTSRLAVGQLYTAQISDPLPFVRTPTSTASARADESMKSDDGDTLTSEFESGLDDQSRSMNANALEDFNDGVGFCAPAMHPGEGEIFTSLNNRTKNFEIFGAVIENEVTAYSLNPSKTYNVLRAFTLIIENKSETPKVFRLAIPAQPDGAPATARASFDQYPFDPAEFPTTPPSIEEFVFIEAFSSESRPAFVFSEQAVNPVDIEVYEQTDTGERLVTTITVNGAVEAGEFLNSDGTVNAFELHNPAVFFPDEFSPDEFSPDEYSPDEYSPDVYSPDEFSASQFNPDEFSPDEFSPDEFSPDEFSPDEFSPDEFSPDEFSPPLIDEATLDNPEIPPPDLGTIEGQVVKKDINYGLQNIGNTITPYTMDIKIEDDTLLEQVENGNIVIQVVVWQENKFVDVQFCERRIVSQNRILAVSQETSPGVLEIPDIVNNSVGAVTLTLAPEDVGQVTLRFIAKLSVMQTYAPLITADNISTVWAAQTANTGDEALITARTLILDNRAPPSFINFGPIDSTTLEATGPDGRLLPAGFVTAERDGDPVTVTCDPALPAQIPLDIRNSPPGPTQMTCTAETPNGVTAGLNLSIHILDNTPPEIVASSVPADIVQEADPDGTFIDFDLPIATDVVDQDVTVACTPGPLSEFPFLAPGPVTTVSCTAIDESGNESDPPETFSVTLQDTSAPVLRDIEPPIFNETKPFVLEATERTFELFWGPFEVVDAGIVPSVDCTPGMFVPGQSNPEEGLYVFKHDFPVDVTEVSCTATDSQGRSASATFEVTVFDETPPEITLLGDNPVTIGLGEAYVDPGVDVFDNSTLPADIDIDVDDSGVDINSLGNYQAVITATDVSGNSASATRDVIVGYADGTGIRPTKLLVELGSSNALFYGWLDQQGNLINVRADTQIMRIRKGSCSGPVVFMAASDKGKSGFRLKKDNEIQFNWDVEGEAGMSYCAEAESTTTGQRQVSPLMEIK